ncbi:MAG: hypothetical protein E6J02_08555 [Chloroflexi bacterium]|nr:MAG: hypothetical protein E6J02_08555 [Chloroflexota bacterium]TME15906.1 MAG: hypothetical protein E6I63_07925 [Chloroflexota bacterium]TME18715.1 MAG: hypothetical protein E6I70_06575 [Chloroflexota bacterium]
MILNSRTSHVDGSSEGGRINTESQVITLALYGVALMDAVRARGHKGKLRVEPRQKDGEWLLVATYADEKPKWLPERWHGRKVVAEKEAPPPSA